METDSIVPEYWFYADLHIHTPASRDYAGNSDKKEYLDILEKANAFQRGFDDDTDEQSNNLISITDHNSVSGYKKLIEIKSSLDNAIAVVKEMGQDSDTLKELQRQQSLFSNIYILMGVEVKPDPGVHMLLIFHEGIDPNQVEEFLAEGYGLDFNTINGDPTPSMKWTISALLDNARKWFGNKVIAIAPHADSSSGLYESLKNLPQPRIAGFKHDLLKAVSYNNPDSKAKIEATLKNKDYKRSEPLVFIQDSDYHGHLGTNIGSQHIRIRINNPKPTFEALVASFSSQENIKCSSDYSKERYSELIDGNAVVKYKATTENSLMLDSSQLHDASKVACSFMNTAGGIIEIYGSITDAERYEKVLSESIESFNKGINDNIAPSNYGFMTQTIQFSQSKTSLLIRFRRGQRLYMVDGNVLVWDETSNSHKVASPSDIECIVAENLSESYGERNKSQLIDLSFEIKRLGKTQTAYPIATKAIPNLEKNFWENFDSKRFEGTELHDKIWDAQQTNMLGLSSGNFFLMPEYQTPPRFPDSYLRVFPPCYQVDELDSISDIPTNDTYSIVVVPGGGAHLASPGMRIFSTSTYLVLSPKSGCCPYSQIAWIKSSFFIWFCLLMLGSSDFFMHVLRKKRNLPMLKEEILTVIQPALKEIIEKIVTEEHKFLNKFCRALPTADDEQIGKLIKGFNLSMDKHGLEIDFLVFQSLSLSYKQIRTIYDDLRGLDIHIHGALDNQQYIDKIKTLV